MRNPVETAPTKVMTQGLNMAQGAARHGGTIDLGPNTAVNIRLEVTGLGESIAAYGNGKDELERRRLHLENLVIEGRLYMMAARDSLKPLLGYTYNSAWDSTGLVRSLKVPDYYSALLPLLGLFAKYLENRPTLELASRGITAARAQQLYTDMENASGAVNKQIAIVGNLLLDRNAKTMKLRRRLRGTIAALTQAIDPMDMLWESFGLNRPGQKSRPDQPEKPTVVMHEKETGSLKWKRPARAAYFRVWQKVKGVDAELLPVANTADLDFLFEHLPLDAEVEFAISAVNPGGESALSETVTLQT